MTNQTKRQAEERLASRISAVTMWREDTTEGFRLTSGKLTTKSQMVSAYRKGIRVLAKEAEQIALQCAGVPYLPATTHAGMTATGARYVAQRVTTSAAEYLRGAADDDLTDEQLDVIVQVGFFGGIVFEP